MDYEQEIKDLRESLSFNASRIYECVGRINSIEKKINDLQQENAEQFMQISEKLDIIVEQSTIAQTDKRAYLDKDILYKHFAKQGVGKKTALNEVEKKYNLKRSRDNCRTHSISLNGKNFRGIIIIK